MKAKSFALAAALLSLSAITASAQCKEQPCEAAEAGAQMTAGDANKMYQPQSFTDYAFEGILLTVEQQDQINEINAKFAPGMCQKREGRCEASDSVCAKKDCKKDCKKDGKKGCKKGSRKDCRKDARDARQQSRADYVMAVKEVLTPDQYTTFLENIVLMPKPQNAMKHGMKAMRGKAQRYCGGEVSCPAQQIEE